MISRHSVRGDSPAARRTLAGCHWVVGGGLHRLGPHVLASAEYDARPFSQKALGDGFNLSLSLGGFRVEDDDFADAGRGQCFFGHAEVLEDGEKLALDLEIGQCSIGVGGLEEEAHGFKKVGLRIDD